MSVFFEPYYGGGSLTTAPKPRFPRVRRVLQYVVRSVLNAGFLGLATFAVIYGYRFAQYLADFLRQ